MMRPISEGEYLFVCFVVALDLSLSVCAKVFKVICVFCGFVLYRSENKLDRRTIRVKGLSAKSSYKGKAVEGGCKPAQFFCSSQTARALHEA